jgi:hypothetical protein
MMNTVRTKINRSTDLKIVPRVGYVIVQYQLKKCRTSKKIPVPKKYEIHRTTMKTTHKYKSHSTNRKKRVCHRSNKKKNTVEL